MDIMSFIPEQLLIIVVVLNVLGVACKSYPILDNKYIPIILLLLGIVFSICLVGLNVTSIMQGILCWGVAIGVNQTYKQFKQ
ncbi:phage holin family protein [Clostridioides mangenotii]|uniref:phage holin family protein n=1 Tax=Metaclostridioides mangenotii TaxID=1540 RepID=UPI001C0F8629|nr:phage holin family protein [Clostridioides mangenotii]MBU5307539.1 phage holin family protein [Clostridioides mangenotii]